MQLNVTSLSVDAQEKVLSELKGAPIFGVTAADNVELKGYKAVYTVGLNEIRSRRSGIINLEIREKTDARQLADALADIPQVDGLIFNSDDAENVIDTAGDLDEISTIAAIFKDALSLGHSGITSNETARAFGRSWTIKDLASIRTQEQILALLRGDIEGAGLDIHSAAYQHAFTISNEEFRKSFLTGIAEKLLIAAALEEKSEELRKQYEQGTLNFGNPVYESMLGEVLRVRLTRIHDIAQEKQAAASLAAIRSKATFAELLYSRYNDLQRSLTGEDPHPVPGAATAIADMLVDSLLLDLNTKKLSRKEHLGLNTRSMRYILSAA
jgi:hypothetical protein